MNYAYIILYICILGCSSTEVLIIPDANPNLAKGKLRIIVEDKSGQKYHSLYLQKLWIAKTDLDLQTIEGPITRPGTIPIPIDSSGLLIDLPVGSYSASMRIENSGWDYENIKFQATFSAKSVSKSLCDVKPIIYAVTIVDEAECVKLKIESNRETRMTVIITDRYESHLVDSLFIAIISFGLFATQTNTRHVDFILSQPN